MKFNMNDWIRLAAGRTVHNDDTETPAPDPLDTRIPMGNAGAGMANPQPEKTDMNSLIRKAATNVYRR